MGFWEKVKKDVQKGLKESMEVLREGAEKAMVTAEGLTEEGMEILKKGTKTVKKKTKELTEEGKRQLKLLELKLNVQEEFEKLGGKIYDLSSRIANPMTNTQVKAAITRIKKLEEKIKNLEKKGQKKKGAK